MAYFAMFVLLQKERERERERERETSLVYILRIIILIQTYAGKDQSLKSRQRKHHPSFM